jgi:hypothetical protein
MLAIFLLAAGDMNWELLLGRSLACCAHPAAAWRILSRPRRALVVGAYFAAGYVAVLVSLLVS